MYGKQSHKAMNEEEEEAETKDLAAVVYVDFTKLHEP